MKKNYWLFILTYSFFFILISPSFLSEGMFFDGTIYSTVAKNFALYDLNFWKPHFTKTFNNIFYGHPPLSMWLHSRFLKLFGNYLIVDKIYSVLTIILTSVILFFISKSIGIKHNWLVLLLWFVNPLIFWTATNNLLENLLSLLTGLSFLFFLLSLKKYSTIMLILSGLSIFGGLLTKGFVSLFPLSAPFFFFLLNKNKNFWLFIHQTSIMLLAIVIPLFILYFFNFNARSFMENYLKIQFLTSFNVVRVSSRFYIIKETFMNLLPYILFFLILILLNYTKKLNVEIQWNKALFVLFVAFSGTLPIMVTLKQSHLYIIPALFFYSIFFAFVFDPFIERVNIPMNFLKFVTFLSLILVFCLNIYFYGKIGRDKDLLIEVKQMVNKIPSDSIVSTQYSVFSNWTLNAYLARYKNISLAPNNANHKFFLHDKKLTFDFSQYEILVETKNYIFLRKLH